PVGVAPLSSPRFEHLTPAGHLRIVRALDLQPGRRAAVCRVPAVRPLREDALAVPGADLAEQVHTAALDVSDVEQARVGTRHYRWFSPSASSRSNAGEHGRLPPGRGALGLL